MYNLASCLPSILIQRYYRQRDGWKLRLTLEQSKLDSNLLTVGVLVQLDLPFDSVPNDSDAKKPLDITLIPHLVLAF